MQQRRPLTDDEMATIRAAADAADPPITSMYAVLEATYDVLVPGWREMEELDPTAVAIPAAQASALMQHVFDVMDRAGLARDCTVAAGLEWVNIGPSSYEPEPVGG